MSDKPEKSDEHELNIQDSMDTQHVSTQADFEEQLNLLSELDTRPAMPGQKRSIRLFVPQEVDPLVFFDPDRLVMGRGGEGVQLDIDLSEQYGWMLGVSRQHAEIVFDMGTYYLTDLGSTNGTFLNSTQLVPNEPYAIESADQIRMGHFLMIVAIP